MRKLVDLAGRRFVRLVVLHRVPSKDGHSRWLCKCDCGKTTEVASTNLVRQHVKSCGCLRIESRWPHHSLLPGVASRNSLYHTMQYQAKLRNHVWEIPKDAFITLTQQPCHYCGILPKQVFKREVYNGNCLYNGLDRVDSSKGYTLDNVVPCCGTCNKGKLAQTKEEFLSWVNRINDWQRCHREEPCPAI